MALTVTMDHPDYPDGYEFGVEYLGILKNRESKEISEEQEQSFVNFSGKPMKESFMEGGFIKVEGDATAKEPEEEQGTQMPEQDQTSEEEATEAPEQPAEEQEGQAEEGTLA